MHVAAETACLHQKVAEKFLVVDFQNEAGASVDSSLDDMLWNSC